MVTSCFIDTILVPLATWLYLTIVVLLVISSALRPGLRVSKGTDFKPGPGRSRAHGILTGVYFFFIAATMGMSILEVVRLSFARLGIGLLPFTFVALLVAAALRMTKGFRKRVSGWRWANIVAWVALAATNGVKLAEELKEGTGARKGTKYPESDEITDVGVMIGLYVILAILDAILSPC